LLQSGDFVILALCCIRTQLEDLVDGEFIGLPLAVFKAIGNVGCCHLIELSPHSLSHSRVECVELLQADRIACAHDRLQNEQSGLDDRLFEASNLLGYIIVIHSLHLVDIHCACTCRDELRSGAACDTIIFELFAATFGAHQQADGGLSLSLIAIECDARRWTDRSNTLDLVDSRTAPEDCIGIAVLTRVTPDPRVSPPVFSDEVDEVVDHFEMSRKIIWKIFHRPEILLHVDLVLK
jgi:hypothetical protein